MTHSPLPETFLHIALRQPVVGVELHANLAEHVTVITAPCVAGDGAVQLYSPLIAAEEQSTGMVNKFNFKYE